MPDTAAFMEKLAYNFSDKRLLVSALTHASYTNELAAKTGAGKRAARGRGAGGTRKPPETNNERLEFLGDAVLELVVSEHIFNAYPELTEGEMTKLRASVVCEPSLSEAAKKLGVGASMRMGRGEEHTGGRERGSILADCFEAVAGAIFIDGGFDRAKEFILSNLTECIKERRESFMSADYKTRLQEEVQRYSKEPLEYTVIAESGPAHDRTFAVKLTHENMELSTGQGKSKKEAEQNCARLALNVKIAHLRSGH